MDHITNDTSRIGSCDVIPVGMLCPESEVPSGRSPIRMILKGS